MWTSRDFLHIFVVLTGLAANKLKPLESMLATEISIITRGSCQKLSIGHF